MEAAIIIIGAFAGVFIGIFFLVLALAGGLAVAPLLKSALSDDPDNPNKLALFTSPEPGRSSIIMRGNRIEHVIQGKEKGETLEEEEQFKNGFLRAYDAYVFKFGLRLIGIPGVHSVLSYDLPRYKKVEEEGKLTYVAVKVGDPGRRTNHFRTQLTPWFNEFTGVDIEGIPFGVKCATNFSIDKTKVEEVAFGTESWNILLDQALNAIVRGVIRKNISLDDAIGGVSQDIWEEHQGNSTRHEDGDESVQGQILKKLLEYSLRNGKKLSDIGIVIEGFEILDFAPQELTEAEYVKLRAPALERRAAQARELAGTAEANYQAKVLTVLDEHKELAKVNVDAEAFVKASKGGQVDAILAGLLKKLLN